VSGDHFLDDAVLDGIGRAETLDVFGEDVFEAGARFAIEDHDFGEQAVAERVLGRDFLAGVRDRAVGESAVGAGRLNSSKGGHGYVTRLQDRTQVCSGRGGKRARGFGFKGLRGKKIL